MLAIILLLLLLLCIIIFSYEQNVLSANVLKVIVKGMFWIIYY